ncbi:carboxypeptidase Q-like [Phymastichus coffea]|uniref:carboxypeptidase Q-like n=1 Tax=Phymastichus coffea TaxID=108790 RepID=UPI00273B860D|nr:carboxypeptidase Q-like [Phymastichus coffea]
MENSFLFLIVTLACVVNVTCKLNKKQSAECELPENLMKEIDSYAPVVKTIVEAAVNGTYKGATWQELAYFVDKFGSRISGSKALEDSIDYVLERSHKLKLDNVHGETVKVPNWIRGKESASLMKPRVKHLAMLGLGYSVGTPPEGITAKAIVVKSFAELKQRAAEVPGCIVVYNQKFVSYNETVQYRSHGASEAAKLGAVAVLIRSVTPFSLYTPHTGMMSYASNVKQIPAACITVEDAALLNRIADRGDDLQINIKMEAKNYPDVESRNIISEVTGTVLPEKVVVVSGHIDSWDVGQGAMDDGGGAFISWNALILLRKLGLQARRTIRSIMWTCEELGIVGATQYIRSHKSEESNLQLVMESDMGTFTPLGLEVTGTELVKCILQRVLRLLKPMGELGIRSPHGGPDIEEWVNSGVPGASLWNKNDRYFWYHHTNADTIAVESPHALDKGTALFAAVSYVIADLSIDLPHHGKKSHSKHPIYHQ